MDSRNLSPFGSELKAYILEATSPGGGALPYNDMDVLQIRV